MTERGFQLQVSKLLVVAVIIATAATGALVVTLLTSMPSGQTPAPGPNGLPPPPPNLRPLAVFSVVTGLFVLSWLAVLVVFARDQILRQIRLHQQPLGPDGELNGLLAGLRAEIAADRERDLDALTERLTDLTSEFGERRETDGYLNGMRTATTPDPPEANVRALRRTPPQR
ncbi:hypothetical protein BJ973_006191 [Actinoplanes tereljensis]|uniref:Uncharacterized protein n=1 Tax=Paractinoplanes tereljensis TaxID=571912 RepID=A0A919TS91_9ACTN|nr:hypothetical protein [Actinoplanes tereljensis]GIF19145.1 hypothetical protein Ate02nite_18750 [Actinoplanes tereljensis]